MSTMNTHPKVSACLKLQCKQVKSLVHPPCSCRTTNFQVSCLALSRCQLPATRLVALYTHIDRAQVYHLVALYTHIDRAQVYHLVALYTHIDRAQVYLATPLSPIWHGKTRWHILVWFLD